jgi:rhodanese-related sulfurtransferase
MDKFGYFILIGVVFLTINQLRRARVMKTEINKFLEQGALVIDVRSGEEFATGHRANSINIPLQNFEGEVKNLKIDQNIIVCCASGGRSAMALEILKRKGFTSVINAGSWKNI